MGKQTFLHVFTKPYPFEARPREAFKSILLIGGFVFLTTLFFVMPSANPSFLSRLQMAACYGTITIAIALFNSFLISALIKPENEEVWKVWHEIMLYVANIGGIAVGNFFVVIYFGLATFSVLAFVQTLCATVLIALMPIVLCVLIGERNKYRKYYTLAQNLQASALVSQQTANTSSQSPHKESQTLLLDENIMLPENDILFLESDKNYVRIKLNSGQEHRVRATLKDVLEKNEHLSSLVRVHRAFIVNKNCIETVDGNAQGLKLQLKNHSDIIPVSRTYINEFKAMAQFN